MHNNTSCHSHLPLISATHTFGHTIITYTVVIPSGNNPTMALLPERERRPLSFKKIYKKLRGCLVRMLDQELRSQLLAFKVSSEITGSSYTGVTYFQESFCPVSAFSANCWDSSTAWEFSSHSTGEKLPAVYVHGQETVRAERRKLAFTDLLLSTGHCPGHFP